MPQAHGGALLRGGNLGNKGGGRPTDEFKRRMRKLVSRHETLDYFRECLDGKLGPQVFLSALQFATEGGYGKVPVVTQVSGADEPLEIILTTGI